MQGLKDLGNTLWERVCGYKEASDVVPGPFAKCLQQNSPGRLRPEILLQSLKIIAFMSPSPYPLPHTDAVGTLQAIREGRIQPLDVARHCLERARLADVAPAFVSLDEAGLLASAGQPGLASQRLGGLPVSIKDLFDVQGQVTAAGSVVRAQEPPARQDAHAVARLREAGAGFIGRSHMVEFAFSGVGINPHTVTPRAWDARSGGVVGPEPRVPGGSSSGAAVSVAAGAALAGLGTDTGGSIRIPAAFNGLVGFKPTARRVPTGGCFPLSPSLDSVGALTLSVRDAVLLHEVLSARRVEPLPRDVSEWRLAVPVNAMLDGMDPLARAAFDSALERLEQAGAKLSRMAFPGLDELPRLMATGGLAPAESHAIHHVQLARRLADFDPRVAQRMLRGADMRATDYIQLQWQRQAWIDAMMQDMGPWDALLSPTTPIMAPTLSSVAPGAERDAEFFRVNTLLLRNTSAVNFLDGCALSLPCHLEGQAPFGLMVWHGPMMDDRVLAVSAALEAFLARPLS